MSKSNRFSVLETEDVDQTDIFKKAAKKLKEIDRLKQRLVHNAEELTKLATESYWRNILNPPTKHVDQAAEAFRKAKQHAKQAKKLAKIKEEEARIKAEEAQRLADQEQRKRAAFIESLARFTDSLDVEFRDIFIKNGFNVNKTFRILSKKYHPDRNIGNQEWAETKQKQLLNCKEKFAQMH